MYCPNCGSEAVTEQKFCRACGLELQVVAQLVAEKLAEKTGAPTTSGNPAEVTLMYRLGKWAGEQRTSVADNPAQVVQMYRLFFAGMCLVVSGVALLVINQALLSNPVVGLAGVLTMLLGALVSLYYGVIGPMIYQANNRQSAPLPVALPAAETTSKLAAAAEPALSVVEHTTHRLATVARKAQEEV